MNPRCSVCLCALLMGLGVPVVRAQGTCAINDLSYFWNRPDPADLAAVEGAVKICKDPAPIRKFLRDSFQTQWIKNDRFRGPTFAQFDALARVQLEKSGQAVLPFGVDYAQLVELLAGANPPGAWHRADFRAYVRDHLPPQSGGRPTTERLISNGFAATAEQAVARYAFLLDVLPTASAQQIHEKWFSDTASNASPEQMAEYYRALRNLQEGFTRFTQPEHQRMLGDLGNRLLKLSPATWYLTSEALLDLVRASQPPDAFFASAVTYFHDHKADRDGQPAGVLAVLAGLVPNEKAFDQLLKPGDDDVDWFAWLHTAPVLQKLHQDPTLLAKSYQILLRLAPTRFAKLFPQTVFYYYQKNAYAEQVFNDLIRPQANGPNAALVLSYAYGQDGATVLRADHRERLALDVLAGQTDSTGAAWAGPGAPSRLQFAINAYSRLLTPLGAPKADLASHLASPLLGEIVTAILEMMRKPGAAAEALVRLMEPLAAHLEQCRKSGADTASSEALTRLDRGISLDMEAAIGSIADSGGEAQMRAVDLFVDRITLALRIRSLVTRALGTTPAWLARARDTLRQRVFGIPEATGKRTLYWSPDITRWRARILYRIDEPLRRVLLDGSADNEAKNWFEGLYLPMICVHGFLKVLKETNSGGYPHLLWVNADPRQKADRLQKVFSALQTDRWLDADEVVTDFALAHLQMLAPPGGRWALTPDHVFAGTWGVNANLRIYRGLLQESPPPGVNWELQPIASRIVDELAAGRVPNGPVFGSEVSATDRQESVWAYASWAGDLVTAAEWQRSPFVGRNGPLPWRDRVEPSGRTGAPFRFTLSKNESTRRVDGQLRLRLTRLLIEHLDSARGLALQEEPLETLPNIAVLLPNHADNITSSVTEMATRSARFSVYTILTSAFDATSAVAEKEKIARQMMRLDVATRTGTKPEPSLASILKRLSDSGSSGPEAAADVDAERLALIAIMDGKGDDNIETARTYIDVQLRVLLPPGSSIETAPHFPETLRGLSESRVRLFLQLRQRMGTVAEALAGEKNRPADLLADLNRVERALELVDSHVWFTRRDFNSSVYFRPVNSARDGKPPDYWWPALLILAFPDEDLQTKVVNALDDYKGASDNRFEQLRNDVRNRILQLNEAIFATMVALASRSDAVQILTKKHSIPWSTLNLRLLAEVQTEAEPSPTVLASGCFEGLLRSFQIAGKSHAPSDEAVWQKLFGSFDYLLPPAIRRRPSLTANLDKAVELSDQWASSDKVPVPLREAARGFAEKRVDQSKDLLSGAATTAGVMRAFEGILDHVTAGRQRKGYVGFYVNALTLNDKTLSTDFSSALAGPFYRGGVPVQKGSIDALLQGWQKRMHADPGTSQIDRAYRSGFASVLASLIRGGLAPQAGSPVIWAPVNDLAREKGLRPSPPAEFLNVAAWLFGLEKRYSDPELGALFSRGGAH